MKNAIIELTSCEIENVSGGIDWRLSWEWGKCLVAVGMGYNYEKLSTYQAIKNLKNDHDKWESAENIATGLFYDLYNFSLSFLGAKILIDDLIPFVVIKGMRLVKRQ